MSEMQPTDADRARFVAELARVKRRNIVLGTALAQGGIFSALAGLQLGRQWYVPAFSIGAALGALTGLGLANRIERERADAVNGKG